MDCSFWHFQWDLADFIQYSWTCSPTCYFIFVIYFRTPSFSGFSVWSIDSRLGDCYDFSTEIINPAGILIRYSNKQYLKTVQTHLFAKPHVSLGSLLHLSHLQADILHCTCQICAEQVWSPVHVQWKPGRTGKTGGKTNLTHFPADVVHLEALAKGRVGPVFKQRLWRPN